MTIDSRVRRATEADANVIAVLAGMLGYETAPEEMRRRLRAILGSDADLVLVGVDASGTLAGWLQAHAACILESGPRIEITGLIISPEARRRGLGRLLVQAAEQWACARSAKAVVVRSNVQRTESHLFYAALGYFPTKTQQVYRKNLS